MSRPQIQMNPERRTLVATNVDKQTLMGIFPELKAMVDDLEANGCKVNISVERVEVVVEQSKKAGKHERD